MKKNLVPSNFSEHAEFALKVDASLAKTHDAEILILNLLDLPTHMNDAINSGVNIPEVMLFLNKTNERLAELADHPCLIGVEVSAAAKIEKAFEGIVTYSQANDVDLIVMGSHGQSGIQDMFIGSNTEKIVRASTIPVLVIKSNDNRFDTKNIVFASDFEHEIKEPFEKLVKLSKIFDAHLNLVMINTPNSFKPNHAAEKMMSDFVNDFDIQNFSTHIYNDTNVEKGVLNFANKVNADLIGVCTHGRTTFAHFFVGSISEGVMNQAARPVLTFRI